MTTDESRPGLSGKDSAINKVSVFFAGVLGSIATLGRKFVGRCRGLGGEVCGGSCETYGFGCFLDTDSDLRSEDRLL